MKKFMLFSIYVLLFSGIILTAKEIKSTKIGGNWNDSKTWVGGKIPTSTDFVKIQGSVIAENNQCKKLLITKKGYLLIIGTTIVHTTLENNGKVEINDTDTLKVYGKINNHSDFHNCGVIEVGQ